MQDLSVREREHESPDAASVPQAHASADLLRFFYPIHYQVATALEDVLSAGVLSRRQVVILQLIRSEGQDGRQIRRKAIEGALKRWFEVTSPQISKALRAMARPPLELIAITEDPRSGREKLVSLTPRGEQFLADTTGRAERYFAELLEEVPPDLLRPAVAYLRALTEAYHRVPPPPRARPALDPQGEA